MNTYIHITEREQLSKHDTGGGYLLLFFFFHFVMLYLFWVWFWHFHTCVQNLQKRARRAASNKDIYCTYTIVDESKLPFKYCGGAYSTLFLTHTHPRALAFSVIVSPRPMVYN